MGVSPCQLKRQSTTQPKQPLVRRKVSLHLQEILLSILNHAYIQDGEFIFLFFLTVFLDFVAYLLLIL